MAGEAFRSIAAGEVCRDIVYWRGIQECPVSGGFDEYLPEKAFTNIQQRRHSEVYPYTLPGRDSGVCSAGGGIQAAFSSERFREGIQAAFRRYLDVI